MITKKALEQLRVSQPKHNHELHYTIGGSIEAQVHSSVEAERIGKLNNGDRRLQESLEQLRNDYAFSSREGQAKAHFNQQTQAIKP
jgi:hypothetical protein